MSDIIIRQGALSRRQVLQWMAAVSATAYSKGTIGAVVASGGSMGYGNDPLLTDPPRQPWPNIISGKLLTALAELVDEVLPARGDSPAASEVGIVLFFEEWLSAPYPQQLADRALLLPLIERSASGVSLRALQTGAAWERFRLLTGAAYFTTPVGMREMGFVGNVPQREFKGPPEEVLRMLDQRFEALD